MNTFKSLCLCFQSPNLKKITVGKNKIQVACLFVKEKEIAALYPICVLLTPAPSSAQRKTLFPLNEEVSSEWEDPKEGKVLLTSDLWSHSQSGLSWSFTTFHSRNEAADCAWSIEGRRGGCLKLRGGGRTGWAVINF